MSNWNVSLLIALSIIFSHKLPALSLNNKAENLQIQARKERENGNKSKAESLYLQAVQEGEKNGYSYRTNAAEELAQWYFEQKNYSKAEDMFKKALKAGERDWAKYNDFGYEFENNTYLSKVYRAKGDFIKANASLLQALSHLSSTQNMSNDDRYSLCKELTIVSFWQIENKKYKEAEISLRTALSIACGGEDSKYNQEQIDLCRHYLAKVCVLNQKFQEADLLLSQVIASRKKNFTILDWEIASPSLDKVETLKRLSKSAQSKELSLLLDKYWPKKAFCPSSNQDKYAWEEAILGSSNIATLYRGYDSINAEKAVQISTKFSEKDIRYAVSNARLAALMLHKDYKLTEPLIQKSIKSIKLALGANNSATASFLEHWGKAIENTSTIHTAPFSAYKEALGIRVRTTTKGDLNAYKGAKQIGNFCKTMFVGRREDKLISMYADAYKVIVLAKGLNDEDTLDALSDFISMLESKYQYSTNPKEHAQTLILYKDFLKAESDFYGKNSSQVKDTARQYVALLLRLKQTKEADAATKTWSIN